MSRPGIMAGIEFAGYHNDASASVRLFTDGRVSREAADQAWAKGVKQKQDGRPCGFLACKDAFHAHIRAMERLHNAGCLVDMTGGTTKWTVAGHVVGTTTGPIGATTGYTITNPTPTPEA